MFDIQRQTMTLDEFLALPENTQPTQFIDGELIMSPTPIPRHQLCAVAVFRTLDDVLDDGTLVFAPSDVLLDGNVLQPDVFWIRPDGDCRIVDDMWQGAPDLVVEILSPSTEAQDRGRKYTLYEAGGVREYWIINAALRFVEVYVRQETPFVRQGVYQAGATFQSPVLNQARIAVNRLFEGVPR